MKLSCVVSTQDARFSSIVYREPFEIAFKKIADLGFEGIELAIRDPLLLDMDSILSLPITYNLKISAIATGQAYGDEGLSLSSEKDEIRKRAIERLKTHIDLANKLRSQVIIGLIRGKKAVGLDNAIVENFLINSLNECLSYAEEKNVRLVLEPINRYETNLLNTVEETVQFLKKLNSRNLYILVDTFHMNIEEPSIIDSIRLAGNLISHVHIADNNRWAPGYGHINFKEVVQALKEVGYDGFLSAEILPKPNPDMAAKMVVETMRRYIT